MFSTEFSPGDFGGKKRQVVEDGVPSPYPHMVRAAFGLLLSFGASGGAFVNRSLDHVPRNNAYHDH